MDPGVEGLPSCPPRAGVLGPTNRDSPGRGFETPRFAVTESAENLVLMRLIDEEFLETPWVRFAADGAATCGVTAGASAPSRSPADDQDGLVPIYQRPKTSEPHPPIQQRDKNS